MMDAAAVAERRHRADSKSPTVACVMLVDGRPEMVKRAIWSFRAQTYERKRLLILDSGSDPVKGTPYGEENATTVWMPDMNGKTIGALRNAANWCAADHFEADFITHLDSDDVSRSRRLEEQVALLARRPDIDCVGYNRALFWDTTLWRLATCGWSTPSPFCGAWIFFNPHPTYVLGASMMYRADAWRRRPFNESPDVKEDYDWWIHNATKCLAADGVGFDPRIVCGIHGSNTSKQAYAAAKRKEPAWERAPQWDDFARKAMTL